MSREEIIRMAREAGFDELDMWSVSNAIERFAAIVAAAEREACAKVCADLHIEGEDDTGLAADLIRARGEIK